MKKVLFGLLFFAIFSATAQNITVTVNVNTPSHKVYPTLFGRNNSVSFNPLNPTNKQQWIMNKEAGVRMYRENDGNNCSKYNWRLKLSSHPNWYNNVETHDWDYVAQTIIDSTENTQIMFAFQMLGYAASSTAYNYDFEKNDIERKHTNDNFCANGDALKYLKPWNADSTTAILPYWFNDVKIDSTRVRYWNMDNEPEVWNATHDDIIPTDYSYEKFINNYIATAKLAKQYFPGIKLVGPAFTNEWQWYNWNGVKVTDTDGTKYTWVEYFIKRIAEEEKVCGVKLIDVLDFHLYPVADANTTLQVHRIWYDTTYSYSGANGIKRLGPNDWQAENDKEYIFIRAQEWLDTYMGPNNGVTFAVSETGDIFNQNPNIVACFYASNIGEFMSAGNVEIFTPWNWYNGMWEVLHLFSRYSGEQAFRVYTNDENNVSVYPTISKNKDTLTLFVVNRNETNEKPITINLQDSKVKNKKAKCLQLANLPNQETFVSHTNNALQETTVIVSDNKIKLVLPALSITMIQVLLK